MPRLALVGNLSLDRVDGSPARVGGPPFYAARALRPLGVSALVATKFAVADRPLLLPPLAALGLPVRWRPATSTAAFSFDYDAEARTMVVDALGETWTPADVTEWLGDDLDEAEWIHVGALARGEFPAETLAALRRGGRARLSLDGQGLVRPRRTGPLELEPDADPEVLGQVTVLKLAEEEAQALAGGLDECSLDELGVPEVIVTLGSRGALVYSNRRLLHVPAKPLGQIDPTGAGDSFAAAYLVARSRGDTAPAAARHATTVVAGVLAATRL